MDYDPIIWNEYLYKILIVHTLEWVMELEH